MRRFKASLLFLALIFGLLLGFASGQEKALVGARHPAISPDGKQVAFSYMGDLWVVSADGGKAYRLTDHVAYEREPVWSPDGQPLAFTSNRFGNNDVFVMKAQGGTPVQLTFHTGDDVATDFTPDGNGVIFRSSRASSSSLYKIPVTGGNEIPVLETYWNWAYHARVSPDGRSLVFSEGMENGYWWRRGYRGANTAKIWISELAGGGVKKSSTTRRTRSGRIGAPTAAGSIMSATERRAFIISGRRPRDGSDEKPVTSFKNGDVRWMSVAARAPLAAYERDFGIWLTDLRTGDSRRVPSSARPRPRRTGRSSSRTALFRNTVFPPTGRRSRPLSGGKSSSSHRTAGMPAISPTPPGAKKTSTGTRTAGPSSMSPISMPARTSISFPRSATGQPRRLTDSAEDENTPRFSPDGKLIAYYRGQRQLRVVQPDGQGDRLLAEDDFGGRFADDFVWSPDGKFIAVAVSRNSQPGHFRRRSWRPGRSVLLTNTAYDEATPTWTADGKVAPLHLQSDGPQLPRIHRPVGPLSAPSPTRKAGVRRGRFRKMFAKEEAGEEGKARAQKG